MPNFDLSLSPSQLELIAKPNSTAIYTYQLTNNTYQNLSLFISLEPWQPQGNDGSVSYSQVPVNPHLTFSLSNADLKLNQTFTLPPQTTKQLILKIKTDSSAPLNDSYYTLFVNQNLSDFGNSNHSTVTAKIGSHLLISIANTDHLPQKGQIQPLIINPKLKDIFFTPLRVSTEVKNITDYYFPISGTLTLSKNNLTIKEIKLSPDNVLAHHSRQLQYSFSPPFWPGKYTATLTTPFAPNASASFYIFPFSLLALLPLVILLTFLFRYKHRKTGLG